MENATVEKMLLLSISRVSRPSNDERNEKEKLRFRILLRETELRCNTWSLIGSILIFPPKKNRRVDCREKREGNKKERKTTCKGKNISTPISGQPLLHGHCSLMRHYIERRY